MFSWPEALCLLIEERKAGDQIIQTVETGLDQVLGVVTEKLQNGKHGQTSIPSEDKNDCTCVSDVQVLPPERNR
jgi:hypothetical protein